jgi:hypothetical protein
MSGARAALFLVAIAVTGCVTVDATLRADGSARLVMMYQTPADATEFLERRRFSSPNVIVDGVKIFEDQTTVVWATVPDVTRLGGSKGFEIVRGVTRERRGSDEIVTITFKNPFPSAQDKPGLLASLSVTFPGPLRDANHAAAVLGSRLTWNVSEHEFATNATVVLRARYAPPPP